MFSWMNYKISTLTFYKDVQQRKTKIPVYDDVSYTNDNKQWSEQNKIKVFLKALENY